MIAWAERTLGVPVYDHYGQTENAMLVINHHAPALHRPLRPGSMGVEMPGFHAVIVDDEGNELGPGEEGQIGLDIAQSPLYWFRGYYKAREWSDQRIIGGYYLTGDAASRDADNYFYFSGRTDDIISTAGCRIGPFEVESALMQHPAVAEVVGTPDELRGEAVTAFVVLKPGHAASEELSTDLSQPVRQDQPFRPPLPTRHHLRRSAPQDAQRQGAALPPAAPAVRRNSHLTGPAGPAPAHGSSGNLSGTQFVARRLLGAAAPPRPTPSRPSPTAVPSSIAAPSSPAGTILLTCHQARPAAMRLTS